MIDLKRFIRSRGTEAGWLALAATLLLCGQRPVNAEQPVPRSREAADPESLILRPAARVVVQKRTAAIASEDRGRSTPTAAQLSSELDNLRRERESLTALADSMIDDASAGAEPDLDRRHILRRQLHELMIEWSRQPKGTEGDAQGTGTTQPPERRPVRVASRSSAPTPRAEADGESDRQPAAPIDPLALAQALLRMHDYQGALDSFRLAEKSAVNPLDRLAMRYFSAVCLARLGSHEESKVLFRQVANSKDDELIAECARWQLAALQWREDVQSRLDRLREGNKSATPETGAAAAPPLGVEP